jgi:hypothetical protein
LSNLFCCILVALLFLSDFHNHLNLRIWQALALIRLRGLQLSLSQTRNPFIINALREWLMMSVLNKGPSANQVILVILVTERKGSQLTDTQKIAFVSVTKLRIFVCDILIFNNVRNSNVPSYVLKNINRHNLVKCNVGTKCNAISTLFWYTIICNVLCT